jgi:hypothetical protein
LVCPVAGTKESNYSCDQMVFSTDETRMLFRPFDEIPILWGLHRRRLLLYFLLWLSLLLCQPPALTAPNRHVPASSKGWIITQVHYGMGEVVIYILPDALKIQNKKFGFVAVAGHLNGRSVFMLPERQ